MMVENRKLDSFTIVPPRKRLDSSGEYVAVIRPTPQNAAPRRSGEERYDPFPDHVAYLNAKGRQTLIDWALGNLPDIAAQHVIRYLDDKNERHLATLTELEREQLAEKMRMLRSKAG